jgi:hypothetical protein
MSLQHARFRKAISDASVAYRTDPIEIEKRREQIERNSINHYWNAILNWTNESNPKSGQAGQKSLSLPINTIIPQNVLDEWESELSASGYYVDRTGHQFKVTI